LIRSAAGIFQDNWLILLLLSGVLAFFLTACGRTADARQAIRSADSSGSGLERKMLPDPSATETRPVATPTLSALASFTPHATVTFPPTTTRWPTHIPTFTPSVTPTPTNTPPPTPTSPPLPTPRAAFSQTVQVPILMYHYVSTPPEGADIYRQDLSVTPAQFQEQMAYLAEHGYTPIDLYDLSLAVTDQQPLPPRPVILTFDDGYVDAYTNAYPILESFGFKGTFFIVTEFVDLGYDTYMTWAMIAEMAAAGHRMESHSKTHPDLRNQDNDHLVWQLLGSQQTLAAHIGYTPRFFCYPGGHYDAATIAVLQELDFWGAVTTAGGEWHGYNDRYEWSRWRIRNTTSLAGFADLVNTE